MENDIELEDIGNEVITNPFNPSQVKIRRDPYTLGQLVDKIKYGEIIFKTPYQRKDDLWNEQAQSRLIESVILNLPLPSFYFDETDSINHIWNVIDGLQRCSVFKKFIIDSTLKLQNLEFLGKQYNGLGFIDLPRDIQRRIIQTPITVILVELGTPDFVKFNLFKRINTGGLILTPQEIRHAMNQGVASDTIAEMASYPEFKKATCYRIPSDRMEDQEFITRFVAFYITESDHYAPDLDTFMTEGMAEISFLTEQQREDIKCRFRRSMVTAYGIWGDDSFRKRTDLNDRRRPLNKTLFEIISSNFARLSQNECDQLIQHRTELVNDFIKLNCDYKFFNAISSGIGKKDSVIIRHEMFKEIINKYI